MTILRLIFMVTLAFELLAHSFIADADHTKIYRIGWLGFGSPGNLLPLAEPFRRRLAELGYVEGENLVFEYRWREGRVERLSALAAELVHAV